MAYSLWQILSPLNIQNAVTAILCHVQRIAPMWGPHTFPWHVICFNPNFEIVISIRQRWNLWSAIILIEDWADSGNMEITSKHLSLTWNTSMSVYLKHFIPFIFCPAMRHMNACIQQNSPPRRVTVKHNYYHLGLATWTLRLKFFWNRSQYYPIFQWFKPKMKNHRLKSNSSCSFCGLNRTCVACDGSGPTLDLIKEFHREISVTGGQVEGAQWPT